MQRKLTGRLLLLFLYACATLQFVRFYCKTSIFYLDMSKYLNGSERLPFQERVLPILFMRPMFRSAWLMSNFAHENGAFTRKLGPFYVLALVSMAIAGIYAQRLYNLLSRDRTLGALVYPLLLFTVIWSYSIHSEANYSYPYDLSSLAFFTAGLFYIYRGSFWRLFAVILVGTFNRETTLFLIGIYVIDSVSRVGDGEALAGRRWRLAQVSWGRVVLLSAVWLGIKLLLAHRFAHNDSSENFLRVHFNLERLTIRFLPALLNMCGYTLPIVLIYRRGLQPERFRNYLYIIPPWLLVMFLSGVLVETRIYGELCSFCAIGLVLILEASSGRNPVPHDLDGVHQFESKPKRAGVPEGSPTGVAAGA